MPDRYTADRDAPASPMSTPQEKPTSRTVKDALLRKYNGSDLTGTQYVCIEEARSGAGFDGNNGSCDFLAINTFKGRGMTLIGHEVKVSLSDWKAEVAQPEKAERFARYCRRWYVAVPAALAAKIKDEVPPAWGLLSLSDKGRWTDMVKAPSRKPEPVPEWWWVGWLAQFDRQAKRDVTAIVGERMAAERQTMQDQITRAVDVRRRYSDEKDQALRENAALLKTVTGIDLANAWSGSFDRLGRLWTIARNGDLDHTINLMRSGLAALEALTQPAVNGSDAGASSASRDESGNESVSGMSRPGHH